MNAVVLRSWASLIVISLHVGCRPVPKDPPPPFVDGALPRGREETEGSVSAQSFAVARGCSMSPARMSPPLLHDPQQAYAAIGCQDESYSMSDQKILLPQNRHDIWNFVLSNFSRIINHSSACDPMLFAVSVDRSCPGGPGRRQASARRR
jgi:hypothetical protein